MNRRSFLISCAACLPVSALAYSPVEYTPSVWREIRKANKPVVMYFRASWSLTSQMKLDALQQIIAQNPVYKDLTFVDVNWDFFGPSQMAAGLKVTRHSTLMVVKNGKEITRLEGNADPAKIEALLNTAISS